MKRKGTKNLTRTQRLLLEDCFNAGLHKKVIAEKLGVCLATVYKELKRGEYRKKVRSWTGYYGEVHYKEIVSYSAQIAEDKYNMAMTAKGRPLKIGNDYDFVRYVEKRVLQDKISPCAVLGEIKRGKMFQTDISKATMYRYIAEGIFLNISMKDLPCARKKKHYRKAVIKRAPKGESIEKRPSEILERKEFGHWEMDCVVGTRKKGKVFLVLTERQTRREIIMLMPDRTAASVVGCLTLLERRYGKLFRKVFKTITVDNGSEFADYKGMEKSSYRGKRVRVYYCHPYNSCERGSNERINRDIRRLAPKGTDFTKFTDEEVQKIEDWVNAYPREIFGFATAAEKFKEQIAAL